MGNYLKMSDKRRVLALLELGWTYQRIERETGVRRETVARYNPQSRPDPWNAKWMPTAVQLEAYAAAVSTLQDTRAGCPLSVNVGRNR
jgi:hypothetical protein